MKTYWQYNGNEIYQGDALDILKQLPDESVNCCVTSPPYWGLRDYGTAKWEGGDTECDHKKYHNDWSGSKLGTSGKQTQESNGGSTGANKSYRDICAKCGAKRIDQQLGLEKTPEEYVTKLVEIFQQVKRVLKSDGTVWLNLGDSYVANMGNTKEKPGYDNKAASGHANLNIRGFKIGGNGLKKKDICGIPWRVAFALQADGWYLRQDIIWSKPNPMPESVKDRCTKSHEYIFLLTKSTKYYYDASAIKEKSVVPVGKHRGGSLVRAARDEIENPDPMVQWYKHTPGEIESLRSDGYANKRSVWQYAVKPSYKAHFAVFPPSLIAPCILAGCPEGGTVIDPFLGSGTTGIVAYKYDRKFIGIDLSETYLRDIAIPRIEREMKQLKLFR